MEAPGFDKATLQFVFTNRVQGAHVGAASTRKHTSNAKLRVEGGYKSCWLLQALYGHLTLARRAECRTNAAVCNVSADARSTKRVRTPRFHTILGHLVAHAA